MASDDKKSKVISQIRENLQRVYDEALKEEIPPDFLEMIERLKAEKEARKKNGD